MGFSWWEQIAGPAQLLEHLINAMRGPSQVVLSLKRPLPFWNELFGLACQQRSSHMPYAINAESITQDPAEFFLQEYAPQTVKSKYRPAMQDALCLLIESKALAGNLFWIIHAEGQRGNCWYRFLREWAARDREKQTEFILEYTGEVPEARKGITVLSTEEGISAYDMLLFAYGEMSDKPGGLEVKQYLAWLTAQLAEGDPELCRKLCGKGYALVWNPGEILGENFANALSRFREGQTRFCLPELERRRLEVVSDPVYHQALERLLPVKDEYGIQICVPEEMELRHILHYTTTSGQKIFSEAMWTELQRMKNIRNQLAHGPGMLLLPEDLTFLLGEIGAEG